VSHQQASKPGLRILAAAVGAAAIGLAAVPGSALAYFGLRYIDLPEPVGDADFQSYSDAKVELGELLFFDKVLGGNRNISCATCHHSLAFWGDGLALPVGEGGQGLGMARNTGVDEDAIHERVPRNAPHIFNIGAFEYTTMFHDGRVTVNPAHPSGFDSPAGDDLPAGLDSPVAVQAMFPVTSAAEMAGQAGENDVADAAAAGQLAGPGGAWDLLAQRLQAIPDYLPLFQAAFPGEINVAEDITYVHAANAIGAFEATAGRADNSPFDQYLRGDHRALSDLQERGMLLFYGKAGCADCHSGPFQTDHRFYAIGMPQIGPGKGDGLMGHDDFGRERVTGDPADRYKFRTLSLRNVQVTGPWGHDGAYDTLEGVVRHHLDAVDALYSYDRDQAALPSRPDLDAIDFLVLDDPTSKQALAQAAQADLPPVYLQEWEIKALIAFLNALTDPAHVDLRRFTPASVPSGLPLYD
jgi:cytochrome c peroxidase